MNCETYTSTILDWRYIYVLCPHCIKNKSKFRGVGDEGTKNKTYKRVYHIYNTNDDYSDRVLKVKSNCLFTPPDTWIEVVIDSDTLKIYK